MVEFLDNLRAKPERARKRIAMFSTVGIFAMVFFAWWMTWTSPVSDSTEATKEVVTPFGIMAGAAAATREGISHLPGEILNQVKYVATSSDPYGQGSVKASDVVYPDQLPRSDQSTTSQQDAQQSTTLPATDSLPTGLPSSE